MKPHEANEYLEKNYPKILFREGKDHTQFSVNGGLSWAPLGPRHSLQDIKKGTLGAIHRQIREQLQLIDNQTQRAEQTLDPKQWAEEVRRLNFSSGSKIHEKPNEQGFYVGVILYKDPVGRFCAQKIGEKSIVLHDARNFTNGLPEKGDFVRINYQNGIAWGSSIKENSHDQTEP